MRPIEEQETVINYYRDSDVCIVYTSDSTVMTKLDKLAEDESLSHWKVKQVHKLQNGELVGKTYETHKGLISFRSDIVVQALTDEQRAQRAERMKALHAQKLKEALS